MYQRNQYSSWILLNLKRKMWLISLRVSSLLFAIHYINYNVEGKSLDDLNFLSNNSDPDWWKTAIFYQIYPRSWMDSDGDGNGDLKGITNRLEHLKDAGITGTWLSPIFQSPKADQGYDISDYRKIDPMFGTNEDFRNLLKKAKKLGIKLILDFVPNHTSDEHEWFQKSVNRTPGYEDFYIWHDGEIDRNDPSLRNPPNNWVSVFADSAWKWNDKREQYYLHQFLYKQPDLNYSNPKVVEAMKAVLTFWLDQGVDGFRVDAVPYLFEDPNFKDEPLADGYPVYNISDYNCLNHLYTKDLERTFDMIYQFREHLDAYTKTHGTSTKILMTEAYSPVDKQMLYYGTSDGSRLGGHFTFNFNFITKLNRNFGVDDIVQAINLWQDNLPAIYTSNWVLGNHDNHRVASRLGVENADAFNMITSILPGVMVTYYGEEIGMENGEVNCTEGQDPSANCSNYEQVSRDFERTPFQWDSTKNAGFSTADETWLPVSQEYLENNLALQNVEGVDSHYNIYKDLIQFRKNFISTSESDTLVPLKLKQNILQLIRLRSDGEYTLLFNIRGGETKVVFLKSYEKYEVVVRSQGSSYKKGDIVEDVTLKPNECVILKAVI